MVCAYLATAPDSSPDATAQLSFEASVPPAPPPPPPAAPPPPSSLSSLSSVAPPNGATITLPSPVTVSFNVVSDAQAFDVFYSSDPSLGDLVATYADDPEDAPEPPGAQLGSDPTIGLGSGQYTITLPIGRPGAYYWEVYGIDLDTENPLLSGVRQFIVDRAAPKSLSLHLAKQNANWTSTGRVTASVTTTPWESLTMSLVHRGKTLAVTHGQAGGSGASKLTAKWRCPTSGAFQIVVTASDGDGHSLTRRASYHTPACGPKPKAHPPGNGGGGGGSGGGGGGCGVGGCGGNGTIGCYQGSDQLYYSDPPLTCGDARTIYSEYLIYGQVSGWSCYEMSPGTVIESGGCTRGSEYVHWNWRGV